MGGKVVAAADRPVEGVTVVMTVSKYGVGKRAEESDRLRDLLRDPDADRTRWPMADRWRPAGRRGRQSAVDPSGFRVRREHYGRVEREDSGPRGPPRSDRCSGVAQGDDDQRSRAGRSGSSDRGCRGRRFDAWPDLPGLRLADLNGCGGAVQRPSRPGAEDDLDRPARWLPARNAEHRGRAWTIRPSNSDCRRGRGFEAGSSIRRVIRSRVPRS